MQAIFFFTFYNRRRTFKIYLKFSVIRLLDRRHTSKLSVLPQYMYTLCQLFSKEFLVELGKLLTGSSRKRLEIAEHTHTF